MEVAVLHSLRERQSLGVWVQRHRVLDPRAPEDKAGDPPFPLGPEVWRVQESETFPSAGHPASCADQWISAPGLPQEHVAQCKLGDWLLTPGDLDSTAGNLTMAFFFLSSLFHIVPWRGGAFREQRSHRINSSY